MTEPPLIDDAAVRDLVDSIGVAGVRSVFDLFIEESRTYVATIVEAAAHPADSARREAARRAAHTLKSSAGQIGAAGVAAAAAAAEEAAAADANDRARSAVALRHCASDTEAALRALLAALE